MAKYTIHRYGTDSSGRPIYMTEYMKQWLDNVLARPRVKPFAHKVTIVQGAWMAKAGGGAADSAGYHDGGGCLDFRTWNLTTTEVNHLIVAMRLEGAAAWRRDHRHGMDPHIHITLGGDRGMTSGAKFSWSEYLAGRDGLARRYRDYEWRPSPIRKFKFQPKQPMWGKKINRRRVNRSLRHQGKYKGKAVTWMLNVVTAHLRKKGYTVKGWDYDGSPQHQHSVWRAIRKFQRNQGWTGSDADGLLGPETARRLGIRSYWKRLKPKKHKKRKVRKFSKSVSKTVGRK